MIRAVFGPKEESIVMGLGEGQGDLAKKVRNVIKVSTESFGLPEKGAPSTNLMEMIRVGILVNFFCYIYIYFLKKGPKFNGLKQ